MMLAENVTKPADKTARVTEIKQFENIIKVNYPVNTSKTSSEYVVPGNVISPSIDSETEIRSLNFSEMVKIGDNSWGFRSKILFGSIQMRYFPLFLN